MSTNDTPAMYGPPQAFPPDDWGKLVPSSPQDSELVKLRDELSKVRAKSNRRKKALRAAHRTIVERTRWWMDAAGRQKAREEWLHSEQEKNRAGRADAATAKQFYAEQVKKYAAEVPKMAERVFEVVSRECYQRDEKTRKNCDCYGKPTTCTFTTCPLDGIKAIREELEGCQ